MFLYRPLFCRVFLVAMAMSRTRSSKEGWRRRTQLVKRLLGYLAAAWCASTHAEHHPLEGVLRFALQPFQRLKNNIRVKPRRLTTPARPRRRAATLTGCLMASPTVNRDVSRTNDGFPSLASM